MEYHYENTIHSPNLATFDINDVRISGIHHDVGNSDMSDKSIVSCRWDEDEAMLHIVFGFELSAEDKQKLDTIVSNNS